MTTARLFELTVQSADTTQATAAFIADQRRITAALRRGIHGALAARGLSGQFAYAAARVPATARSLQVYASDAAAETIRQLPQVRELKVLSTSSYPLTRSL